MADRFYNLTWASLASSGDGELCRVDLGSAQPVCGIELIDLNLSGARLDSILVAEYSSDAAAWSAFDAAIAMGGNVETRRIMAKAAAGLTARYVRLCIADPSAAGGRSLTIAALRVLSEGAQGGAKFAPFTYDDDASYMVIVSARNAEVYESGERVASVSMPFLEGSLARLDFAQRLDTMLVFHENYAPWRVFRLGADADWDAREQVFDSMRQVKFDDTSYTNGANEVQQLEFFDFSNGDTFTITLDGQSTGSIAFSSTGSTLAASIKSALEALPVLINGTATVTSLGSDQFRVTFTGDAGQQDWPEMAPSVVSSGTGVVTSATITEGREGGEDAISASRGYPRCGAFADSRLLLGGPRSLPQTVLASKFGEYFSFEETHGRATDAIEFTIDTDDANGIRRILNAETVQIFTASGAHFLSGEALVADEPTQRRKSGNLGIQLNIPPFELDNGTVFIQKGGRGVRELQYNENIKRYQPVSLSVRAPSLIDKPVDAFVRKTGVDHEDELFSVINRGGWMACFTSLKEQGVSAWGKEEISGYVLGGGADSLARSYYLTEREINGEARRYIEIEDVTRTLDCSVIRALDDETDITGLEHLEGREDVFVVGNGAYWGPLTVASGRVQLDEAQTGDFEVGLFFDAWVTCLEPRIASREGATLLDVKKRICDVTVSMLDSTPPGLTYRHGVKSKTYPFKDVRPDARNLDRLPLSEPMMSGPTRIEGLKGWDRSVDVKIFRRMPGPFHIRSLKMGVQV